MKKHERTCRGDRHVMNMTASQTRHFHKAESSRRKPKLRRAYAAFRPPHSIAFFMVAFTFSASMVAAGEIDARISRVGLFAGANPVVRSGTWSFAEVGLRYTGDAPFDGELRLEQLDRDGDVAASTLPVALAPDGEWRDFQVYFVPHDVSGVGNEVVVKLYDAKGSPVRMKDELGAEVAELKCPAITEIPQDDFLIVDLTLPRKLAHVAWLDQDRRKQHNHANPRQVRLMSPREIPSRWQGLAPVDAIVWEDADPSGLSDLQVQALIDWVKSGGRLLISSGKNWQTLMNSPLAEALPAKITGAEQREEALEFLDLVANEDYGAWLARKYLKAPITRCLMRPAADAIPIPAECPNPQIAFRRLLGRGSIILLGAPLNQLLPPPKRVADLDNVDEEKLSEDDDTFISQACERVVARRLLALPLVREKEGGNLPGFAQVQDLFSTIRSSISFEAVGAMFLVFAITFAFIYTLGATLGSYTYMKRRSWEHHNWSAFAAVSVAACLLSVGIVWVLRGVDKKLMQTTVIDALASTDYGYGHCLFGLKTPNHTRLDLRVPVGPKETEATQSGTLHVMPGAGSFEGVESKFVAPEEYQSVLAGEKLLNVPVRATLKEFQGFWHGPLGGTLDAKLVAVKSDKPGLPYEFGEESFIRNNLGFDLKGCYLLETRDESAGENRSIDVTCFELGDLPSSGADSQLDGEQIRRRLYYRKSENPNDPPERIKSLPRLGDLIRSWRNRIARFTFGAEGGSVAASDLTAQEEYYSLLLLSVYDLMRSGDEGNNELKRTHGRPLDCSRLLTRKTAVLIGYSEAPPPATLEVGTAGSGKGRRLVPTKSLTIYRFVIPVERK